MKRGVLAALLLAALMAAPGADATRHRPAPCVPKHAHTLLRSSSVRTFYVEHPGGASEYGTPATVYACVKPSTRRLLLEDFSDTDGWQFSHQQIKGRFLAYALDVQDVACGKYGGQNCGVSSIKVWDLRHRKQLLSVAGAPDALVMNGQGRIAWLTPPDSGTGARTLYAWDSAGQRTLDTGNIDPTSLAVSGSTVSWSKAGVPATATLG